MIALRLLLALPLALPLVACSDDGGDEPPATGDAGTDAAPVSTEPTFARVITEVMTLGRCGGPFCHSSAAAGFSLGSPAEVYAQLIDEPATGALCRSSAAATADAAADADAGDDAGSDTHIRVVPGDPEASLLYQKLSGSPPCGDMMPPGQDPDPEKAQLVYDWIAAGAKDD